MRKRKGLFLDKYIQVERIALIIFALAGLVFLIYISTINQDSESGASSDRPSADVSFDPGDRPFETLRVDEVPGIAFLDQYGYGYSTKDADEIAASVGFLNGISVLDRYEREGEGAPELAPGSGNYYEISIWTDRDIVMQVMNPYIRIYGYTYKLDKQTSDALDEWAAPFLALIEEYDKETAPATATGGGMELNTKQSLISSNLYEEFHRTIPDVRSAIRYLSQDLEEVTSYVQSNQLVAYGMYLSDNDETMSDRLRAYIEQMEREGYTWEMYDATISSTIVLENGKYTIKIHQISDLNAFKEVNAVAFADRLQNVNIVVEVSPSES